MNKKKNGVSVKFSLQAMREKKTYRVCETLANQPRRHQLLHK
jgi:hypothetical protein